jgi:hypothetical protein
MKKILSFYKFIYEAVSVPEVIDDFVNFIEESPVVEFYPEDTTEEVRQGWINQEHKMYSIAGIKRYFKEKYGTEYSSNSIDNAIVYAPNIEKLEEKLQERGLFLQVTNIKASHGDTYPFYSVNLTDSEREEIKLKYEQEFRIRNRIYYSRRAEAIIKSRDNSLPIKNSRKNEALELLIECLLAI